MSAGFLRDVGQFRFGIADLGQGPRGGIQNALAPFDRLGMDPPGRARAQRLAIVEHGHAQVISG